MLTFILTSIIRCVLSSLKVFNVTDAVIDYERNNLIRIRHLVLTQRIAGLLLSLDSFYIDEITIAFLLSDSIWLDINISGVYGVLVPSRLPPSSSTPPRHLDLSLDTSSQTLVQNDAKGDDVQSDVGVVSKPVNHLSEHCGDRACLDQKRETKPTVSNAGRVKPKANQGVAPESNAFELEFPSFSSYIEDLKQYGFSALTKVFECLLHCPEYLNGDKERAAPPYLGVSVSIAARLVRRALHYCFALFGRIHLTANDVHLLYEDNYAFLDHPFQIGVLVPKADLTTLNFCSNCTALNAVEQQNFDDAPRRTTSQSYPVLSQLSLIDIWCYHRSRIYQGVTTAGWQAGSKNYLRYFQFDWDASLAADTAEFSGVVLSPANLKFTLAADILRTVANSDHCFVPGNFTPEADIVALELLSCRALQVYLSPVLVRDVGYFGLRLAEIEKRSVNQAPPPFLTAEEKFRNVRLRQLLSYIPQMFRFELSSHVHIPTFSLILHPKFIPQQRFFPVIVHGRCAERCFGTLKLEHLNVTVALHCKPVLRRRDLHTFPDCSTSTVEHCQPTSHTEQSFVVNLIELSKCYVSLGQIFCTFPAAFVFFQSEKRYSNDTDSFLHNSVRRNCMGAASSSGDLPLFDEVDTSSLSSPALPLMSKSQTFGFSTSCLQLEVSSLNCPIAGCVTTKRCLDGTSPRTPLSLAGRFGPFSAQCKDIHVALKFSRQFLSSLDGTYLAPLTLLWYKQNTSLEAPKHPDSSESPIESSTFLRWAINPVTLRTAQLQLQQWTVHLGVVPSARRSLDVSSSVPLFLILSCVSLNVAYQKAEAACRVQSAMPGTSRCASEDYDEEHTETKPKLAMETCLRLQGFEVAIVSRSIFSTFSTGEIGPSVSDSCVRWFLKPLDAVWKSRLVVSLPDSIDLKVALSATSIALNVSLAFLQWAQCVWSECHAAAASFETVSLSDPSSFKEVLTDSPGTPTFKLKQNKNDFWDSIPNIQTNDTGESAVLVSDSFYDARDLQNVVLSDLENARIADAVARLRRSTPCEDHKNNFQTEGVVTPSSVVAPWLLFFAADVFPRDMSFFSASPWIEHVDFQIDLPQLFIVIVLKPISSASETISDVQQNDDCAFNPLLTSGCDLVVDCQKFTSRLTFCSPYPVLTTHTVRLPFCHDVTSFSCVPLTILSEGTLERACVRLQPWGSRPDAAMFNAFHHQLSGIKHQTALPAFNGHASARPFALGNVVMEEETKPGVCDGKDFCCSQDPNWCLFLLKPSSFLVENSLTPKTSGNSLATTDGYPGLTESQAKPCAPHIDTASEAGTVLHTNNVSMFCCAWTATSTCATKREQSVILNPTLNVTLGEAVLRVIPEASLLLIAAFQFPTDVCLGVYRCGTMSDSKSPASPAPSSHSKRKQISTKLPDKREWPPALELGSRVTLDIFLGAFRITAHDTLTYSSLLKHKTQLETFGYTSRIDSSSLDDNKKKPTRCPCESLHRLCRAWVAFEGHFVGGPHPAFALFEVRTLRLKTQSQHNITFLHRVSGRTSPLKVPTFSTNVSESFTTTINSFCVLFEAERVGLWITPDTSYLSTRFVPQNAVTLVCFQSLHAPSAILIQFNLKENTAQTDNPEDANIPRSNAQETLYALKDNTNATAVLGHITVHLDTESYKRLGLWVTGLYNHARHHRLAAGRTFALERKKRHSHCALSRQPSAAKQAKRRAYSGSVHLPSSVMQQTQRFDALFSEPAQARRFCRCSSAPPSVAAERKEHHLSCSSVPSPAGAERGRQQFRCSSVLPPAGAERGRQQFRCSSVLPPAGAERGRQHFHCGSVPPPAGAERERQPFRCSSVPSPAGAERNARHFCGSSEPPFVTAEKNKHSLDCASEFSLAEADPKKTNSRCNLEDQHRFFRVLLRSLLQHFLHDVLKRVFGELSTSLEISSATLSLVSPQQNTDSIVLSARHITAHVEVSGYCETAPRACHLSHTDQQTFTRVADGKNLTVCLGLGLGEASLTADRGISKKFPLEKGSPSSDSPTAIGTVASHVLVFIRDVDATSNVVLPFSAHCLVPVWHLARCNTSWEVRCCLAREEPATHSSLAAPVSCPQLLPSVFLHLEPIPCAQLMSTACQVVALYTNYLQSISEISCLCDNTATLLLHEARERKPPTLRDSFPKADAGTRRAGFHTFNLLVPCIALHLSCDPHCQPVPYHDGIQKTASLNTPFLRFFGKSLPLLSVVTTRLIAALRTSQTKVTRCSVSVADVRFFSTQLKDSPFHHLQWFSVSPHPFPLYRWSKICDVAHKRVSIRALSINEIVSTTLITELVPNQLYDKTMRSMCLVFPSTFYAAEPRQCDAPLGASTGLFFSGGPLSSASGVSFDRTASVPQPKASILMQLTTAGSTVIAICPSVLHALFVLTAAFQTTVFPVAQHFLVLFRCEQIADSSATERQCSLSAVARLGSSGHHTSPDVSSSTAQKDISDHQKSYVEPPAVVPGQHMPRSIEDLENDVTFTVFDCRITLMNLSFWVFQLEELATSKPRLTAQDHFIRTSNPVARSPLSSFPLVTRPEEQYPATVFSLTFRGHLQCNRLPTELVCNTQEALHHRTFDALSQLPSGHLSITIEDGTWYIGALACPLGWNITEMHPSNSSQYSYPAALPFPSLLTSSILSSVNAQVGTLNEILQLRCPNIRPGERSTVELHAERPPKHEANDQHSYHSERWLFRDMSMRSLLEAPVGVSSSLTLSRSDLSAKKNFPFETSSDSKASGSVSPALELKLAVDAQPLSVRFCVSDFDTLERLQSMMRRFFECLEQQQSSIDNCLAPSGFDDSSVAFCSPREEAQLLRISLSLTVEQQHGFHVFLSDAVSLVPLLHLSTGSVRADGGFWTAVESRNISASSFPSLSTNLAVHFDQVQLQVLGTRTATADSVRDVRCAPLSPLSKESSSGSQKASFQTKACEEQSFYFYQKAPVHLVPTVLPFSVDVIVSDGALQECASNAHHLKFSLQCDGPLIFAASPFAILGCYAVLDAMQAATSPKSFSPTVYLVGFASLTLAHYIRQQLSASLQTNESSPDISSAEEPTENMSSFCSIERCCCSGKAAFPMTTGTKSFPCTSRPALLCFLFTIQDLRQLVCLSPKFLQPKVFYRVSNTSSDGVCYQASSHVWALPADTTALLPQRSALVSERKGNIVTPLKDFETGRLEAPHTRRCQLENAIGESAPYDDVLAYTEGYTTSVGPQLRLKNLLSVPLEIILFLDVLLIKNAVAHEGESTDWTTSLDSGGVCCVPNNIGSRCSSLAVCHSPSTSVLWTTPCQLSSFTTTHCVLVTAYASAQRAFSCSIQCVWLDDELIDAAQPALLELRFVPPVRFHNALPRPISARLTQDERLLDLKNVPALHVAEITHFSWDIASPLRCSFALDSAALPSDASKTRAHISLPFSANAHQCNTRHSAYHDRDVVSSGAYLPLTGNRNNLWRLFASRTLEKPAEPCVSEEALNCSETPGTAPLFALRFRYSFDGCCLHIVLYSSYWVMNLTPWPLSYNPYNAPGTEAPHALSSLQQQCCSGDSAVELPPCASYKHPVAFETPENAENGFMNGQATNNEAPSETLSGQSALPKILSRPTFFSPFRCSFLAETLKALEIRNAFPSLLSLRHSQFRVYDQTLNTFAEGKISMPNPSETTQITLIQASLLSFPRSNRKIVCRVYSLPVFSDQTTTVLTFLPTHLFVNFTPFSLRLEQLASGLPVPTVQPGYMDILQWTTKPTASFRLADAASASPQWTTPVKYSPPALCAPTASLASFVPFYIGTVPSNFSHQDTSVRSGVWADPQGRREVLYVYETTLNDLQIVTVIAPYQKKRQNAHTILPEPLYPRPPLVVQNNLIIPVYVSIVDNKAAGRTFIPPLSEVPYAPVEHNMTLRFYAPSSFTLSAARCDAASCSFYIEEHGVSEVHQRLLDAHLILLSEIKLNLSNTVQTLYTTLNLNCVEVEPTEQPEPFHRRYICRYACRLATSTLATTKIITLDGVYHVVRDAILSDANQNVATLLFKPPTMAALLPTQLATTLTVTPECPSQPLPESPSEQQRVIILCVRRRRDRDLPRQHSAQPTKATGFQPLQPCTKTRNLLDWILSFHQVTLELRFNQIIVSAPYSFSTTVSVDSNFAVGSGTPPAVDVSCGLDSDTQTYVDCLNGDSPAWIVFTQCFLELCSKSSALEPGKSTESAAYALLPPQSAQHCADPFFGTLSHDAEHRARCRITLYALDIIGNNGSSLADTNATPGTFWRRFFSMPSDTSKTRQASTLMNQKPHVVMPTYHRSFSGCPDHLKLFQHLLNKEGSLPPRSLAAARLPSTLFGKTQLSPAGSVGFPSNAAKTLPCFSLVLDVLVPTATQHASSRGYYYAVSLAADAMPSVDTQTPAGVCYHNGTTLIDSTLPYALTDVYRWSPRFAYWSVDRALCIILPLTVQLDFTWAEHAIVQLLSVLEKQLSLCERLTAVHELDGKNAPLYTPKSSITFSTSIVYAMLCRAHCIPFLPCGVPTAALRLPLLCSLPVQVFINNASIKEIRITVSVTRLAKVLKVHYAQLVWPAVSVTQTHSVLASRRVQRWLRDHFLRYFLRQWYQILLSLDVLGSPLTKLKRTFHTVLHHYFFLTSSADIVLTDNVAFPTPSSALPETPSRPALLSSPSEPPSA